MSKGFTVVCSPKLIWADGGESGTRLAMGLNGSFFVSLFHFTEEFVRGEFRVSDRRPHG